jgi:hypothetical protein
MVLQLDEHKTLLSTLGSGTRLTKKTSSRNVAIIRARKCSAWKVPFLFATLPLFPLTVVIRWLYAPTLRAKNYGEGAKIKWNTVVLGNEFHRPANLRSINQLLSVRTDPEQCKRKPDQQRMRIRSQSQ